MRVSVEELVQAMQDTLDQAMDSVCPPGQVPWSQRFKDSAPVEHGRARREQARLLLEKFDILKR